MKQFVPQDDFEDASENNEEKASVSNYMQNLMTQNRETNESNNKKRFTR